MTGPGGQVLRGGTVTQDSRLDAVVQFDERSRGYAAAALPKVADRTAPRSYTWGIPGGSAAVLDQGSEGACVGFGWTALAEARPKPHPRTNADALQRYRRAQVLDDYPETTGEPGSPGGSSVLGGAKASVEAGDVASYSWAFSVDELLLALSWHGPVVLGIPWYDGMYEPQGDRLTVSGSLVGRHCILARAVDLRRERVLLRNSWGPDWGKAGDAWVSLGDLQRLLGEDGEACVPVKA